VKAKRKGPKGPFLITEIMMLQDKILDYQILADACKFYRFREYEQIEVPWIVCADFAQLTMPESAVPFVLNDGAYLVGSAEQGFVQMALLNQLDYGKFYFSVSPCFRNEKRDDTHSTWFMKVELFHKSTTHAAASNAAMYMMDHAIQFFRKAGVIELQTARVDTGIDIMADSLEIGSYGVRQISDFYVAFGTGAALPRLQLAIEASA
jgi:seryl-tRNA synthetase